jgi:hypothetical protein
LDPSTEQEELASPRQSELICKVFCLRRTKDERNKKTEKAENDDGPQTHNQPQQQQASTSAKEIQRPSNKPNQK